MTDPVQGVGSQRKAVFPHQPVTHPGFWCLIKLQYTQDSEYQTSVRRSFFGQLIRGPQQAHMAGVAYIIQTCYSGFKLSKPLRAVALI